jgi:hypothetical protein
MILDCDLSTKTLLNKAINKLYGNTNLSFKAYAKIKQAEEALGITCLKGFDPNGMEKYQSIYQWHYNKVKSISNDVIDNTTIDLIDKYKQTHYSLLINQNGQLKRTTVRLERYWLNAIHRKNNTGIDCKNIQIYLKQLIADNEISFDGSKTLAQQVKCFIIESLV